MPKIVGYSYLETVEGDTFDRLALEMYNNEMQATLLMAENPDYITTMIFPAGVRLKIPILDGVDEPDTLPPWRRSSV